MGIGPARACIEQGCFRRILQEFEPDPIQVMIYYSSRHYLPAKTRLFIDYLLQHAQDESNEDLDRMLHKL